MRNFLNNLCIVGATNCWEEGETLKYCVDNLLKWCDYVVLTMDNPNQETEDLVKKYAEKYPSIIRYNYSDVPKLKHADLIRRREKVNRSRLVESKLALVKKIHAEDRPVDILLNPDSDEVYTDYLPTLLKDFWQSDYDCIFIKSIDIFQDFNIIQSRGLMSHFRICKYRPDTSFTPRRDRTYYYPYNKPWKGVIGTYVHFSHLTALKGLRTRIDKRQLVDVHPETKLWKINKPAWELTPKEYKQLIITKSTWILEDYEKLSKTT